MAVHGKAHNVTITKQRRKTAAGRRSVIAQSVTGKTGIDTRSRNELWQIVMEGKEEEGHRQAVVKEAAELIEDRPVSYPPKRHTKNIHNHGFDVLAKNESRKRERKRRVKSSGKIDKVQYKIRLRQTL